MHKVGTVALRNVSTHATCGTVYGSIFKFYQLAVLLSCDVFVLSWIKSIIITSEHLPQFISTNNYQWKI